MIYEIAVQAVYDIDFKIRAGSLPEAETIVRQMVTPQNVVSRLAKIDDNVIDYNQDTIPTVHINHHKEVPE